MNEYEDELMHYEDDAEDRFDDYDYDDEMEDDDFDTGFDGLDEEDYDGYDDDDDDDDFEEVEYISESDDLEDDEYDGYSKKSVGKIDANDRTLTVIVKNKSTSPKEVVLFGAFANIPIPDDVTVEVAESSMEFVKAESIANSFLLSSMRYTVSDPLQFDNVLKLVTQTSTGRNESKVFQPRNSTNPQNFTDKMIFSPRFNFPVSGGTHIAMTIMGAPNGGESTAVFTFNLGARTNMANLLKGRNVAEISSAPVTTGLPQIDMLQRRRRSRPKSRVRRIIRKKPSRRRGRRTLRRRR